MENVVVELQTRQERIEADLKDGSGQFKNINDAIVQIGKQLVTMGTSFEAHRSRFEKHMKGEETRLDEWASLLRTVILSALIIAGSTIVGLIVYIWQNQVGV